MWNFIDLSGQRFGRLLVVSRSPSDGKPRWLCRCDCGQDTIVKARHLRGGETTSCGCFRREVIGDRQRTHGMRNSPEYLTWQAMKRRCYTPTHKDYANYGGRGISICDRWLNSFEAFLGDMGPRPEARSIDRINNDGNYEPGNCRWATASEQSRNTRDSVTINHLGRTMPLVEAADLVGVNRHTARSRLKTGRPLELVLSKDRLKRRSA